MAAAILENGRGPPLLRFLNAYSRYILLQISSNRHYIMANVQRGVIPQQINVVADVRQQLNELKRKLIERQRDFLQRNNEIITSITELTVRLDNVGKPLGKKLPARYILAGYT
jgi:uncharacterized coiled-coil DUF342 family protein